MTSERDLFWRFRQYREQVGKALFDAGLPKEYADQIGFEGQQIESAIIKLQDKYAALERSKAAEEAAALQKVVITSESYHDPLWLIGTKPPVKDPCPNCGEEKSMALKQHGFDKGCHCPRCGSTACPRDCW